MTQSLYIDPSTILTMRPYAGSEISDCIKEACNLSKILNGNVKFTHNGISYMADKDKCIKLTENNNNG